MNPESEILDRFSSVVKLGDRSVEVIQAVSFDHGVVEIMELEGKKRVSVRLSPEAGFNLFEKLRTVYGA